jgi:hypothetical protein
MSSEALPYNVQYIIYYVQYQCKSYGLRVVTNINHDGQSSRGV